MNLLTYGQIYCRLSWPTYFYTGSKELLHLSPTLVR